MNWYADSPSQITSDPGLTSPGGTSASVTTAAGASTYRQPRAGVAASASTAAVASMVRRVPISGISSTTGRKVPRIDPAVDSAYRRPAISPAPPTQSTARPTPNGGTTPNNAN